jgi:hypothetical protein
MAEGHPLPARVGGGPVTRLFNKLKYTFIKKPYLRYFNLKLKLLIKSNILGYRLASNLS